MINMVLVQNPFAPFRCVLEKNALKRFSPAWWPWQAVLNFNHISIKLQADSNILASPEAGRGNCFCRFPASQEDKYRDKKIKIK